MLIKLYIFRLSLKFEVNLKYWLESISSSGGVTDRCAAICWVVRQLQHVKDKGKLR